MHTSESECYNTASTPPNVNREPTYNTTAVCVRARVRASHDASSDLLLASSLRSVPVSARLHPLSGRPLSSWFWRRRHDPSRNTFKKNIYIFASTNVTSSHVMSTSLMHTTHRWRTTLSPPPTKITRNDNRRKKTNKTTQNRARFGATSSSAPADGLRRRRRERRREPEAIHDADFVRTRRRRR